MKNLYTQYLEFFIDNGIILEKEQILDIKSKYAEKDLNPKVNIKKTKTKIPNELNFDLVESINNETLYEKLEKIAIWLIDHDKENQVSKVIANAYWKCRAYLDSIVTRDFDQVKNYKLIFTPLAPLLKEYVNSTEYQKIKDDIILTIQLINDESFPKPSEETFVRNLRDFSTIYVRDLDECLKIMQGNPQFHIA